MIKPTWDMDWARLAKAKAGVKTAAGAEGEWWALIEATLSPCPASSQSRAVARQKEGGLYRTTTEFTCTSRRSGTYEANTQHMREKRSLKQCQEFVENEEIKGTHFSATGT